MSLNVAIQITPQHMIINMARGIHIGHVLSAPVAGNWTPAFTESYFIEVAAEKANKIFNKDIRIYKATNIGYRLTKTRLKANNYVKSLKTPILANCIIDFTISTIKLLNLNESSVGGTDGTNNYILKFPPLTKGLCMSEIIFDNAETSNYNPNY
ncbi:hypothetical protein [Algibacter sp. 2305UL17-15]|uniref:hypothetical protein n=1 Tax=Algibacter sp. 2305UL17-15 TaxID=3231268 RepID=UPI003459232B